MTGGWDLFPGEFGPTVIRRRELPVPLAVRFDEYGDVDVLNVVDVPRRSLGLARSS